MIICGDEHVSPVIVRIVGEICLRPEHRFDHVATYQAQGVADEIWVRRFANQGGGAVVSADANMTRRPHEIIAIAETGLRLIILPSQWANAARNLQAAHILYWWPYIEDVLAHDDRGGRCRRVPWGWSGDQKAIVPVPLDLQAAYKKAGKDRRGR